MNRCVPDWNMEGDHGPFCDFLPTASQRKSEWPDHELMELLWKNGHVVMHSQAQRRVPPVLNELRDAQKTEKPLKCGGSSEDPNNSVQEDETMPWFQFPLDDSLDKDFCFDFFYGMPTSDSIDSDKPSQDVIAGKCLKFGSTKESNVFRESVSKQSSNLLLEESTMTPPDTQVTGSITHASGPDCGFINFSHFSRSENTNLGPLNGKLVGEKWLGNQSEGETGESSSMITKGSSHCGSNQFQNQVNLSHTWSNGMTDIFSKGSKDDKAKFVYGRRQTEAHETVVTSSSGGSGCSFGRIGQQIASNQGHKRKGRDAEEYECQSEETGYESVEANKQVQRSASARKNRAAEVHNLSERRRRDRINEKMKALQELIPYCNKSDKASMLDEAIEYLKSLQLQVQMMWMGSGMAPMMFSGVQQYISRMGMGIGHSSMPSFHSHVQFPRVPLVNQSMPSAHAVNQLLINPSSAINPTNFQNQIQNAHLPGSYAPYLGFHHMQSEVQGMNLCMYGSQLGNQIQTSVPASNSSPPNDGVSPSKTIQNDESDNKDSARQYMIIPS